MIEELSEAQFIDLFSEKEYRMLVEKTFNAMKEMPEYKNDHPFMHSLLVFPISDKDGKDWSLIIEANLKKMGSFAPIIDQAIDFGIVKISITDEEMPDEVLDSDAELESFDAEKPHMEKEGTLSKTIKSKPNEK